MPDAPHAQTPSQAPQSPDAPHAVRLTDLRADQTGVLVEARLDSGDAALLRAMGLCDRSTIRLCRLGEPCVVAVGGRLAPDAKACTCGGTCRIGLARPLADRIFVTVLG